MDKESIVELQAALTYATKQYKLFTKSKDRAINDQTIRWYNIIHILRVRIEEKIKQMVTFK